MLKTKLCTPKINKYIVNREKAEEKLKLLPEYRLAFVFAPAGYGKTTTVASYLLKSELKYAWFSIDEADNDPVRFWRYLTASIASELKNSCFQEISINMDLVSANITADLLIDMLGSISDDIVLVLDDYHLIHNETVQKSVEHLAGFMPPNLSLIILSRKEPERELFNMCVRENAIRIDINDLSFSPDETSELFMQRGIRLDPEELKVLQNCTEGWAAGLIAASFSILENNDVGGAVHAFSGKNRNIEKILLNEVFDQWTDEVKEFFIHTSFLDKLTGPLCGAVSGNGKSAELLRRLSESNSFIIPIDQENKWFRYHHLFQEFLMNRLETKPVLTRHTLYRLAGEWYRENGFMQDSISCFLEAEEYEKAFPLVWNIYLSMVQKSEFKLWRKYIESMPQQLCESDVRACTGYSWVLSMEGQLEKAQIWADKAQACYDRIKDSLKEKEKIFLEANICVTYANTAIFRMNAAEAVKQYRKVLTFNLDVPVIVGEMNSGEPNLLKTAYGFRGRLNKVAEAYENYVEDMPRFLGDFSSYIAVTLAECNYERGDLKAVHEILLKNMGRITSLNNPGIIVPCFIIYSKVKRARGDLAGAFKIIQSGKKILKEKSGSVWNYFFDIYQASLYLYAGDAKSASQYLHTDRMGVYDVLSAPREFEYITYARYLVLTNQPEDSLILLNRLENLAQKEDRLGSLVEILCLSAIAYSRLGNFSNSMLSLHKALSLGAPEGYVRTFADELEPMAGLLREYGAWTKRTEYSGGRQYAKRLLNTTEESIKIQRNANHPSKTVWTDSKADQVDFSARELEVLRLLMNDCSNREIAETLFITVRTVKFHNARIYEKLGVKNRIEAVIKARNLNLMN
ncbi:LuxR C-terminal-related transcriptional regulator [Caproiciproducens sp.]|uniref:LuxR C-terminal-related transcriptional regulator n=1 Tax=Caproiciproducens sp. TaxID=1954376 RepID=UPI002898A336|nr:LuxR C-terminal-related transcriptional regulator [Caproiciproducens sp.]